MPGGSEESGVPCSCQGPADAYRATVNPHFGAFVVLVLTCFTPFRSFVRLRTISKRRIVWSIFWMKHSGLSISCWFLSLRIDTRKLNKCSSKSSGTFWLVWVDLRVLTECCCFQRFSHIWEAEKSWRPRPSAISLAFWRRFLFLTTLPSARSSSRNKRTAWSISIDRTSLPWWSFFSLFLLPSHVLMQHVSLLSPFSYSFSVYPKLLSGQCHIPLVFIKKTYCIKLKINCV